MILPSDHSRVIQNFVLFYIQYCKAFSLLSESQQQQTRMGIDWNAINSRLPHEKGEEGRRKRKVRFTWAMVSTWMGDHSSVEVDAVLKNTVKSQEWRNDASNKTPEAKKKVRFTPRPLPPPPIKKESKLKSCLFENSVL